MHGEVAIPERTKRRKVKTCWTTYIVLVIFAYKPFTRYIDSCYSAILCVPAVKAVRPPSYSVLIRINRLLTYLARKSCVSVSMRGHNPTCFEGISSSVGGGFLIVQTIFDPTRGVGARPGGRGSSIGFGEAL